MTETVTESTADPTVDRATDRRTWTFVAWGVALWAVAAIAVRLFGDVLLVPDAPLALAAVFGLTVPATAAVTLALYRLCDVAAADRARAAVLLVLPVALLDAGALVAYGTLFPTLAPATARLFAVWVLLAYVGVLAAAVVGDR